MLYFATLVFALAVIAGIVLVTNRSPGRSNGAVPTPATAVEAARNALAPRIPWRLLLPGIPIPRHVLIDAIPDPILVVSNDGRILEANRAARDLGGMGREPIGCPLDRFPHLAAAVAERLTSGEVTAELCIEGAGAGGLRAFDVEVTPYPAVGPAIGRVLLFHDVTDRSALENRLVETLAELRGHLEENGKLQSRLREQAIRDPLTNLFNRHHCSERRTALLAEAARSMRPLAVVMMDIDHFKAVNDRFGHPVGDRVLAAFAGNLRAIGPERAEFFRYGGEEFLALLPDTRADMAERIVEAWRLRFLQVSAALAPLDAPVGFSAGVSVFPSDATDWATLVRGADVALYAAKTAGRGRTCVWNASDPGGAIGSPVAA